MSQLEDVLTYIKLIGIVHSKDLVQKGIPAVYLARLVKQGKLRRLSRGIYCASDKPIKSNEKFVQIALALPNSAISLVSALKFHGLYDKFHHFIYVTIPTGSRAPKLLIPDLVIIRSAPAYFKYGREEHMIENNFVYVYSAERAILDCFKFRNRIGLDIAIDALRLALQLKKVKLNNLKRLARAMRLSNVIAPYLTTLR